MSISSFFYLGTIEFRAKLATFGPPRGELRKHILRARVSTSRPLALALRVHVIISCVYCLLRRLISTQPTQDHRFISNLDRQRFASNRSRLSTQFYHLTAALASIGYVRDWRCLGRRESSRKSMKCTLR